MTEQVRDAYDAVAEQYAALAPRDLVRIPGEREWLAAFAELAASQDGAVADLGCGPGHIVNHLSQLGVPAVGYDISPRLIAEARRTFPDLEFHVGDLTALGLADSSVGGVVARYSLIHMFPARLDSVFGGWRRLLEPGAPVLVSFFAASTAQAHGSPFDHAVTTAYELFPAAIARQLQDAGFRDVEVATRSPLEGERLLDHATVLARQR